ncbi:putative receptor-like protein kinase At3g47110 [Gossypium raimondii]|uniref:non-specific serine/threonine protein kinase n=1 Tax=Gossypium raimondii TaxID=29730 RepID=A0A0D2V1P2_GOSRA|nr:putative receptor-like protein kinase At3g47110 [Gossypium raimondii]KJB62770.1 hypothetical protein B456_009G435400 [Gossypium raimondii]
MEIFSLKNQWINLLCIIIFTLLSISSKPATLALRSNENDMLALLSLKDQLVGDSHGVLTSWNASFHCCQWQGVQCGRRHQRVVSLNMSGLSLAGFISPAIGNLTFLREVDFSYNKLQGSIPREVGHLRRLVYLSLEYNHLNGEIPQELSNCSNLQEIAFNANNITGEIPVSLGDMKNLIELHLAGNLLIGGIPDSLGNISTLKILSLEQNKLKGTIPSSLGKLSNLEYMYIGTNKLSGSVPPVHNFSSLLVLDAAENQLSGNLPPEIDCTFPNLEAIFIGLNQLTGEIPRSISNISSLELFDIALNGFTGSVPENMGNLRNLLDLTISGNYLGSGKPGDLSFLSSLSNCSRLQSLAINYNHLYGVIPDSIANFSIWLEELFMGDNQIIGHIPQGIGNLINLDLMEMKGTFIAGEIPISIGNLQNLEGLYLGFNHLSGKIPSSIGNLSRLSDLNLSNNKFAGAIPLSLKQCTNLQKLDLSTNNLNGSIPYQLFGAFERLIYLNLSHNSFTGSLPSDMRNMKNLVEFYVHNNNFHGEIPMTLGGSLELTTLFMQKNSFHGTIPQSFASLRSLENLDLSNNNLSGTIPPELQKLPFLVRLNLSFNQLEGEVPKKGVFKNATGFSFFGNKNLCGGIPKIQLPKCFSEKPKEKGKVLSTKTIIAIIISILLGSILVVLLVYHSLRQKARRGTFMPSSLFDNGCLRLSYKELLECTHGFASSNLIGTGSFGSVYKGVLYQHEKPLAVKVLNLRNHRAARSFIAECKALRKIRHRNLVKIITSCSSIDYQGNEFKALVFEFMPNGSLESWIHEQHDQSRYLNIAQRLDIAIDMANAIDYLQHGCGTMVVHCDLKPSNVLLDDDMVAHVADFGLAKLLSTDTSNIGSDQTSSSVIKGTTGYVAPEYGMSGSVSPEGDIYSYGIMLLEMITGRRPTCDLFHDGLSLHNFCKMALREGLKEIFDVRLVEEIGVNRKRIRNKPNMEAEIWECFVSFTKIGVSCSTEVATDRLRIRDAIIELHATKARLLRTGFYGRDNR